MPSKAREAGSGTDRAGAIDVTSILSPPAVVNWKYQVPFGAVFTGPRPKEAKGLKKIRLNRLKSPPAPFPHTPVEVPNVQPFVSGWPINSLPRSRELGVAK